MDPTLRRALDVAWDHALAPWRDGNEPLSILFSGGVDSGLLAWELRDRARLTLVTIGVEGAADLAAAGEAAEALGREWRRRIVTAVEVDAMADRFRSSLVDLPPTIRAVQVAIALALDAAPSRDVLCGQGADELFLGYSHYRNLRPEAASARATADLALLLDRDWARTREIAGELGREVSAPYLDPAFVRAAQSVPLRLRLPSPQPKQFLREWARHRGLPASIAERPKRAFQFGSGVERMLSAHDRTRPRRTHI